MRIFDMCGFESGDVTPYGAFSGGNGTIVTSPVSHGTYACRINGQSGVNSHFQWTLKGTTNSHCLRVMIRFAALPSAERAIIRHNTTVAIAGKCSLNLGADGIIRLYENVTLKGTTTTVMSANTWYTIELRLTNTATPRASVRINGVEEITDATITAFASFINYQFGTVDTVASALNIYFDDIALSEDTWIGVGGVWRLLLTGIKSDNANFTIGGSSPAATKWQSLNEAPTDDGVTTLVLPVTSGQKITFTLADPPGDCTLVRAMFPRIRAQKSVGTLQPSFIVGVYDWHENSSSIITGSAGYQWFNAYNAFSPLSTLWDSEQAVSAHIGVLSSSTAGGDFSTFLIEIEGSTVVGATLPPMRLMMTSFESSDYGETYLPTPSGTSAVSNVRAKTGTYSFRINPAGGGTGYLSCTAPVSFPLTINSAKHGWAKFAMYVVTRPSSGNMGIFYFSGSNMKINMASNGALFMTYGTAAPTSGLGRDSANPTAANSIPTGQWVDVEVYHRVATSDASSNSVTKIYVDGTLVMDLDTGRSTTNAIGGDLIRLGSAAAVTGGCDIYFDDFSVDLARRGSRTSRFAIIYPNAYGTAATGAALTTGPSTGLNRYDMIDDPVADDDTTYLVLPSSAATEYYAYPDLPEPASAVLGVNMAIRHKGGSSQSFGIRSDGIDTTDSVVSSAGYLNRVYPYVYPGNENPWTQARVNALETFVKWGAGTDQRFTRMLLVVEYEPVVTLGRSMIIVAG